MRMTKCRKSHTDRWNDNVKSTKDDGNMYKTMSVTIS